MQKNYLYLLCLLTAFVYSDAKASGKDNCCGEYCFPEKTEIDGQPDLIFRSCTDYSYLWFELYTAALYTQEKCGKDPFTTNCSKQLVLKYKRNFTVDNFVDGANAVIKRQVKSIATPLQQKISQFHKLYRPVSSGDSYTMRYEADRGTKLILNNTVLGEVAGEDFSKAYFGIWLGEDSLNDSARKQLLSF